MVALLKMFMVEVTVQVLPIPTYIWMEQLLQIFMVVQILWVMLVQQTLILQVVQFKIFMAVIMKVELVVQLMLM